MFILMFLFIHFSLIYFNLIFINSFLTLFFSKLDSSLKTTGLEYVSDLRLLTVLRFRKIIIDNQ